MLCFALDPLGERRERLTAQVALAVSSGRADAFTTTVLASMVMKTKNPGLGDFVNPTPRIALADAVRAMIRVTTENPDEVMDGTDPGLSALGFAALCHHFDVFDLKPIKSKLAPSTKSSSANSPRPIRPSFQSPRNISIFFVMPPTLKPK